MNEAVFNRKTTVVELLGILCIFSVFLDKAIRGVFAFDFYYNYPIFFLFLAALVVQKGTIVFPPRWFMIGCLVIFTCSFLILTINNLLGFEFWKQVIGIMFTSIVYYNVLFLFRFDVKKIFGIYLVFAYWVALFGVVDNVLHIAGIHLTTALPLGNFLYREFSIMGEPFYLALALTPAIAYYIAFFNRTWKFHKKQFVVILVCYLITYSSIAIAGLVLSVLFSLYLNDFFNLKRNRLIIAPIIIIPLAFLLNVVIDNVNLINVRLIHTRDLFFSDGLNVQAAGRSNSSTFSLYSNYIIARDSFLKEPLLGAGLGSHPLIYKQTFLEYFPSVYLDMFGPQNQQDANSKFLRLMGETGLVGLVIFFMAYFRFLIRKRKVVTNELKDMAAINYAIFVYILLCLVRNGNYINVGFFLFMFIYYLTWKHVNLKTKNAVRYEPRIAA